MSSLTLVRSDPNDECFYCLDTFTDPIDNPPMKHEESGLLHSAAGHKLCWRKLIKHKIECPFCNIPLNYSSLFSWTEMVREIPSDFIKNASVVALTGISLQVSYSVFSRDALQFPVYLDFISASLGALMKLNLRDQAILIPMNQLILICLRGIDLYKNTENLGLLFSLGYIPQFIGFIADKIAVSFDVDREILLPGLMAAAAFMSGGGLTPVSASLVGGAFSAGIVALKRLFGRT